MILVFVSFEQKEHAEKFAHYVIDTKLAACIQLLPVTSFYTWKGEKVEAQEVEAVIKTTEDKFELLEEAMKEILSYEVPQLIAVKSENVNTSYLQWVKESLE